MGRYANYFCCSVPNTLLIVGLTMSILYFLAAILTLAFYASQLLAGGLFLAIFSNIAFIVYIVALGTSCCLTCAAKDQEKNVFTKYNTIITISSIFAVIDGICKLIGSGFGLAIFFFLLGFFGFFSVFVAHYGKKELIHGRQAIVDFYQPGQPQTCLMLAAERGDPKFEMPIVIERVEMRDLNSEMEGRTVYYL